MRLLFQTKRQLKKSMKYKNRLIADLKNQLEKVTNEKYDIWFENQKLISKLEETEKALNELAKINEISPGNIKMTVDKATKINEFCDLVLNNSKFKNNFNR